MYFECYDFDKVAAAVGRKLVFKIFFSHTTFNYPAEAFPEMSLVGLTNSCEAGHRKSDESGFIFAIQQTRIREGC